MVNIDRVVLIGYGGGASAACQLPPTQPNPVVITIRDRTPLKSHHSRPISEFNVIGFSSNIFHRPFPFSCSSRAPRRSSCSAAQLASPSPMPRPSSQGGGGGRTAGVRPSQPNGRLSNGGCAHAASREDGAAAAFPVLRPPLSLRWSEEEWRGIRRFLEAATKGFAIGAGLKGGLALFSLLVRLRSRRSLRPSARRAGAFTNEEAAILALKETLRYGLFLGTFAGSYVSVDEIIAAFGGRKRTAGWRSLLAGLIAGPSMLLTGPKTQHTSLAIYILMRAAVLASRCGIKSKRFGGICRPLTWSYGDIFLMCLASSQILSAYILKQDSLPSSYRPFLNKHGGKDAVILQGISEIASNIPFSNLEGVAKYYKSVGVDVKLDPKMKVPCSIVHGNQSCAGHFISFLFQEYGRAIPVYLPVYLVPALVVHRQDLLKRPYTILGKSLLGTARSSLFLSVYCASAWAWTCLLFRILKRCNVPMVVAGTFPTGLSLLIEKKSRRIEISLYCLARAIESFSTCMADAGLFPEASKLKRADVAVFSLATAIIMHCYAQEREVFRAKYLNVLDWVFGVPASADDEDCKKKKL